MKSIQQFLSEMRDRGVKLWDDEGYLGYSGPEEIVTPELLEQLKARKDEILTFLQKAGAGQEAATITRVPRTGRYPLSFSQQRFWFLEQQEGPSATYNMPGVIRLRGTLDIAVLERSLIEHVRRHESLRTTFTMIDSEACQIVREDIPSPLTVVDLSDRTAEEREREVVRLAEEEALRPFDLGRDLLVRVTVLRLGQGAARPAGNAGGPANGQADEHVLLVTMHHIASDGWSLNVFSQELTDIYNAYLAGEPSPLSDLPFQYVDFACWQRKTMHTEGFARQLAYWKGQLGGDIPALDLPLDYPRTSHPTFEGKSCYLSLDRELREVVAGLSQRHGTTLFMTMLAAFKVLLMRLSGQDDILVGTPIAGRGQVELERLVGLFIQTVVLRADLSGDPSFEGLLGRVKKVTLDAYANQDAPFERIVEILQPTRELGRTPLFQILFNMLPDLSPLSFNGVTTGEIHGGDTPAKYDLTLYVRDSKAGMSLRAVYNSALFTEARIAIILDQYHQLLRQIVAEPRKAISAYSLVTPQTEPTLPDPTAELPEPFLPPITAWIKGWAERTPAQVAIAQGARVWTYRELVDRAEVIARAVAEGGHAPGAIVAIHGRRSFGLIASMLGALCSGGAILMLDPRLPLQRRDLMRQESGAKRLIVVEGGEADEDTAARQIAEQYGSILRVSAEDAALLGGDAAGAERASPRALPDPSPDAPAYIFFTSGTTGVPKGILGRHKGLSHFLRWQRETFLIEPADRCGQLTALSFDVVLRDIFLPLISGATLVLPEEMDEAGGERVLSWLDAARISRTHTVPSLAQTWLLDRPRGATLQRLRTVFFAGEPLTSQLIQKWREAFPAAGEIVNLYGPTETTLAKCFYRVPAEPSPGIQPVGTPLPETQALVLAGERRCGVGELGEIVIRTPFRTLGYINQRADEQGSRFIRNPFRDDADDIVYRTGDSGRHRPDGLLEIEGRLDGQVKIRGIRIELSEIEAALNQHPDIRQSVVMVHGDGPNKQLVAYVVLQQGDAPSAKRAVAAQWRASLRNRLPDSMIPAMFIPLDAIPLSPNGKIDRRSLPAPDPSAAIWENAFVLPRTAVEKQVAAIWCEILEREQISVHDDFFHLGGHSLMATQVMAHIRRVLNVELPLRRIFEHRTVASLAEHIEVLGIARGMAPEAPATEELIEEEW